MDMNAAAIFARVVEAKGFSAAARLLDMPKATVSKKVGDLEADLGTRLLNRTTRALSLTEAGARAYGHIVVALGHMDAAEREARAIALEPSGLLSIAAPGAIGTLFMMPLIHEFMARHPAIQIEHHAIDTPIDLGEERIDVMIWPGDHDFAAHTVTVAQVEIALYASRDYVARNGVPLVPADLVHHGAVAFIQALHGGRASWRLRKGQQSITVAPAGPIRFRSNDPRAILAAVAAGQGIGSLPRRFIDLTAADQDIVPILPGWTLAPIQLKALYRDGSAASKKARLFIDFVADWFARNAQSDQQASGPQPSGPDSSHHVDQHAPLLG